MAGLQEYLELQARALGPLSAAGKNPLARLIVGTNAGGKGPLAAAPNTYYVDDPELNVAGWTRTDTGDVFVTPAGGTGRVANTAAHEAFHSRVQPMGGMPEQPTGERARQQLAQNMVQIQPPDTAKDWGLRPNRSAEEQIANLAGYEGGLPAGTPITQSPLAPRLFAKGFSAAPQEMINYYYHNSSLPHAGVWSGQSPEPTAAERIASAAKAIMRKALLGAGIRQKSTAATTQEQ